MFFIRFWLVFRSPCVSVGKLSSALILLFFFSNSHAACNFSLIKLNWKTYEKKNLFHCFQRSVVDLRFQGISLFWLFFFCFVFITCFHICVCFSIMLLALCSARKLEKSFHLVICCVWVSWNFVFCCKWVWFLSVFFLCFLLLFPYNYSTKVVICSLVSSIFALFCCIELAIRGKLDWFVSIQWCMFCLFFFVHFIICKYKYWLYMIYLAILLEFESVMIIKD